MTSSLRYFAFLCICHAHLPGPWDVARFKIEPLPAYKDEIASPMRLAWRWASTRREAASKRWNECPCCPVRRAEYFEADWLYMVFFYADDAFDASAMELRRQSGFENLQRLLGYEAYYRGELPVP